ncbi:polysaccharide biosynthesis/export family protein [Fervidobacterium thailandense]|uniref:Polysaccharide export protein n=1 Tax=Fervidobacterium thailandense TaxID=1008305 RepID=A0A1E3G0L9_9BACT|nr:polysaccharide biosynthesis/export family protein [Fervidobacterium thailandense]ODN29816.1 polysaccharide export protein [Fervidobacterium thailandense]
MPKHVAKKLWFGFLLSVVLLSAQTVVSYTIRVGDVIGIDVFNQPTLSRNVTVALDGTISYPYVGTVKAAGLTVDQLRGIIEQGVRRILKDPIVTVYIVQHAPAYVYIQGAINTTVNISTIPNLTLTRLFSHLGINKNAEVDFSDVRIIRSGQSRSYNMLDYIYGGILKEDPVIQEGDIVYLPPLTASKLITVNGAYTLSTPFEPGMTLRTVLLKLGPLDRTKAMTESSSVLIDGRLIPVNLEDVVLGKFDLPLKPGASVYIPRRDVRYVYVVGFVPSPGMKEFQPEERMTLALALTKAGGIQKNDEKWIRNIKIIAPDGKVTEYDKEILGNAVNVSLSSGTTVEVIKHPEFRIYLTGDLQTGIITFDPEEPKTLAGLLSKIGGLKTADLKWIQSVTVNGRVVELSKATQVPLSNNDVVEIKKYPEFKVYITGDFTNQSVVSFEPDEPKTLQQLLVKLGGLKTDQIKWIESIKLNGQTVDLSKLSVYSLNDKDVVEIKKYPEFRVYLTGDFTTQTQIIFEPDEPRTIQQLLVKVGGLKTDQLKWIESIKLNGQPVELSKLSNYTLKDKDVVEIRKYPEFRVYITGDFTNQTQVNFEPDEPKTLEQLFIKIGGFKTDQLKWIESVKLNGQRVDLSKLSNYVLKDKDVVEIKKYPEFYVYVQGLVNTKGRILFDPEEKRTLKTLLAKVGLPNDEVENEGMVLINNETTIAVKDVLYGTKDLPLALGDMVQVSYEPFIVNVIGPSAGTVQLSYKEPRTLSYLVKKVGITDPESVEKIVLVRGGKQTEYDAKQLLFGNIQIPLSKLDTVVVKPALANAVYVTGDVAAYVTFASNEPITLQRVISKIGLSDLRRVDKIIVEGKEIPKESDVQLQRGTIVNVSLKKPIFVTAMGYIRTTGRVTFEYYETADLKNLFAKLGGLIINPESYYSSDTVYIIRDGRVVESFNAFEVYTGVKNAELKDGDFVYVTETQPKQVYVFGKGMPNGLVRFTVGEEFDLRTLIGKLGGMRDGVSKNISIVDGEKVQTITWNEYVNMKLTTNAIVLFDVDKENFIYIIDANGKPDMFYTDRPVTLYEVLTKVGLNKNYRRIEITSGTQKQTVQLKDISQARSYNVKPGDVIRVLDVPENFAYVLGEVNRPGIITLNENTTVLQAIIQAGYFTSKAVPSSVWLYKGGVNGKPVRVNLQAAVSGGNIDFNPVVEPGDIVFVPTDMFKTALEWIPIINNLIQFYNNVSNLFK